MLKAEYHRLKYHSKREPTLHYVKRPAGFGGDDKSSATPVVASMT